MKEKILQCKVNNPNWSAVKISQEIGCDYSTVKHHLDPFFRKKHSEQMKARRKNKKIQLVKDYGGKCQKCGYDKCLGALDFHHRDGRDESFKDRSLRDLSIEILKKELEKCILVCSNCHREIHYNLSR